MLVNNAGYSLLGNFEELTIPDIESLFATNFWGVAYVMRAALPVMRKQRSGHIINISSTAGVVGLKHCSAYSATKFAVEGLSLATATEVEPFGVKITLVEPGFFLTDLLAASSAKYANSTIADYAAEGPAEAMWSPYDDEQDGQPGQARRRCRRSSPAWASPPQVFVGGSDGLAMVVPAVEARLRDMGSTNRCRALRTSRRNPSSWPTLRQCPAGALTAFPEPPQSGPAAMGAKLPS